MELFKFEVDSHPGVGDSYRGVDHKESSWDIFQNINHILVGSKVYQQYDFRRIVALRALEYMLGFAQMTPGNFFLDIIGTVYTRTHVW